MWLCSSTCLFNGACVVVLYNSTKADEIQEQESYLWKSRQDTPTWRGGMRRGCGDIKSFSFSIPAHVHDWAQADQGKERSTLNLPLEKPGRLRDQGLVEHLSLGLRWYLITPITN